jgi:hypothetical protein
LRRLVRPATGPVAPGGPPVGPGLAGPVAGLLEGLGMVRLFTGRLATEGGIVDCLGSFSDESRSGIILCRAFRLSGFLTFDLMLSPIDATATEHHKCKVDTLRTCHNGLTYVMALSTVGSSDDGS